MRVVGQGESMMNHQDDQVTTQHFLPGFAPSFLEDHARRLVNHPQIALVELVANCWDAGYGIFSKANQSSL
jgi:hypothetical protein